jgi:hypothetical protein
MSQQIFKNGCLENDRTQKGNMMAEANKRISSLKTIRKFLKEGT